MTTTSTASFFSKVQLPEVMLFFYVLALVRQYLWLLPNNYITWALAIILTLSIFWFALFNRPPSTDPPLSYRFWLVVGLPLLAIYAIRFAYPDVSFDVLQYHIIAGERGLSGFPSRTGDFFAVDFVGNPLGDMITAIFRHMFGYRGGTIVNYLVLLWTGAIIVKFLRRVFKHRWLIHFATLAILLTETLLFQINNYMVDLLSVPLLLEATYQLVFSTKSEPAQRDFYIGFLLGLAMALKVTNATFVLPLALLWLALAIDRGRWVRASLVFATAFILPVAFYTAYLYTLTGNPLYPFFHSIFTSTDLPSVREKDPRWGPFGLAQAPIWPALLHWNVERISELHVYEGKRIYAGKVTLGYFVAIFFFLFWRSAPYLKRCGFLMLLGAVLWSVTTGYVRYACYLEVLAGILVILLIRFIAVEWKRTALTRALILVPVVGGLAVSCFVSMRHVAKYEWSMRPTVFDNTKAYLDSARFLFRDYSLNRFVCSNTVGLFAGVDVWIKSGTLTSAFLGGLNPDAPAINVAGYLPPSPARASTLGAEVALSVAEGKRMFSLSHSENLKTSIDAIRRWGLNVGRVETVLIPYYSSQNIYKLSLIEVLPRQLALADSAIMFSVAETPLPESARRASITPETVVAPGECVTLSDSLPIQLKAGSIVTIQVKVANASSVTWPALGRPDGAYKVNLGSQWRAKAGPGVILHDARAGLLFDLLPGQQVAIPITVTAPLDRGAYSLEFDMVQEQIGWFAAAGSHVATVDVVVE